MTEIGKMIEEHKTVTGMSDTAIAKECGLSKQTIMRLRHGGKATPLTIGALSRYFGVPYRTLAESNERLQPQPNQDI